MTLSRMHLGMLGIVSVFTGMISPVVRSTGSGFPFPLTDLQIPAYLILLILAVISILLAVRAWSGVRIFGLIVLALLGYLFVISWSGEIRSHTGGLLPMLSWGWIFITMGCGLLMWSMFGEHSIDVPASMGDHLLGWLAAIAMLALTGLIISISYIASPDRAKQSIIANIFSTGMTETLSGVTRSGVFPSIEKMVFDRKRDALSFFTASGTQMVSIPSGLAYDRVPYATTRIAGIDYTIGAEGVVTKDSGTVMGRAILPQEIDDIIVMSSGSDILSLSQAGLTTMDGSYRTIEDITTTRDGRHSIWRSRTASGYTLYRDGSAITGEYYQISHLSPSSDGRSVMALARDEDGSQYIIKNGIKIQQIAPGYIEGTLRMNGTESIYAAEQDGDVTIIHNGSPLDRKFDEIREVYLDTDGTGYVYFGRPLGESSYCLYTRYRGNLCGLTGYMNPRQAPDSSVVYAGLVDGAWGIYRNTSPIIRNTGYPNQDDISHDYAFFDITNPSYYLFIRGGEEGYRLYKKGTWINDIYRDVGLDATFGYDNKVIMSVQDDAGWRVIEF